MQASPARPEAAQADDRGTARMGLLAALATLPLLLLVVLAFVELLRQTHGRALLPELALAGLALLLGALVLALSRLHRHQLALGRAQARDRERLQAAQRIAGVGWWEYDVAVDRLVWSPELFRIFGIEPADFGGHAGDFVERVHPDDRERMQAHVQGVLQGRALPPATYRILRPDGSVRQLEHRAEERDEQGRRLLLGTARDVTELTAARARLQDTERQYRYLFDQSPAPLAVYDLDQLRVLAVNEAMATQFGYPRVRLLGMDAASLLQAGEEQRLRRHLAQLPPGQTDAGVFHFRAAEERRLDCQVYGQPILFDGQHARLVMLLDVTQSLRIQAELLASEKRFAAVAQVSNDAIWDYNVRSGLVWWSDSHIAMLGYHPDHDPHAIDDWFERIHPDDRARVRSGFRQALAGLAGDWQDHYRYARKDGSHAAVLDRATIMRDADGRAVRVVGGMVDQTRDIEVQQALEQRERGYRELLLQLPLPLLVLQDGRVTFANAAARRKLGGTDAAVLEGVAAPLLFDNATAAACERSDAGLSSLSGSVRTLDGRRFEAMLTVAAYQSGNGSGVQLLVRDLEEERRAESERIERESFFRLSADGFCILDGGLRIRQANATLAQQLASTAEALGGRALQEFVAAPAFADIRATLQGLAIGATLIGRECATASGSSWLEWSFVRARADAWFAAVRDISRQHRAEAQARLLQRAVEAAQNGILVADAQQPDLPLVYANPAFGAITGYALDDALGRNCRFLHGSDREQPGLAALRTALAEGSEVSVVLRNYRRDGSLFWNELLVAPVRDEDGRLTHFVGVQQDITETRRNEERLAFQALHDELTGLPNRRALLARLRTQSQTMGIALLLIDIDQFKLINDTLGHAFGDEVLRALALRLRGALAGESLLARFGGDEFVVTVPREQPDSVQQALGAVLAAVREPLDVHGMIQHLTPSIGVALAPEHGHDAETLVRNADAAMYEAKKQGRNAIVFYSAPMHAAVRSRLDAVSRLRNADLGSELALHYQTMHDGRNGDLIGVELLLRWPRGPEELRHPEALIPVLEETGLILPVGRWVIGEACRRQRMLQGMGPRGCRVAINVSALQIMHGELVADVQAALAAHDARPELLELELTESALMADPRTAEQIMWHLKRMGVGLAIDDFGTGYSSLAYLKRLPVDRLKIDRTFVRDVLTDPDDALICGSIIALAHNLGLEVVAEGVETLAQRQWLSTRNCDAMQGYLFTRPQAFADAVA
ncbi:MAG: EAL domain-containing protein [Xanthomonadaceae bacterium]|nr:EAL domain-containing protein [Xanthomonadaceae bacterium]